MGQDLSARGFGQLWGHTRSYSNQLDSDYLGPNGYRWFIKEIPQLGKDGSGNIAVIGLITEALWFNKSGSNYVARHFIKETLAEDTVAKEFTFRDTTGRVVKFFSFDASIPTVKQGQLKSYTDPYGHTTTPSYDASNRVSSTVFGSGTTRGYYYDYYSTGNNAGRMQYATLKRGTTNVRRAEYAYYDTGDANGSVGDLKSAKLQQWNGSSWDTLGTTYYRYYTSGTLPGFVHGLKHIVNQEAYARMVAAGITPETATDTQVEQYADHYFEYDASKRVVKEKIRGGLMTYQYAYSQSAFADGYNNWKTKTTETLPDSNQNIVYTNYAGQIILKVFNRVSDSAKWYEYYLYDTTGLVTQRGESNAVASYSEASAGLVTLNSGSGLIHMYDYYATTDLPNGAVATYLQLSKVKQGSGGTAVKIREWKYTSQTVGATTIYPISKEIAYFSDASGGSNPQETSYSYAWFSGTFQVQQRTTTWAIVPTSQYGSGVTTSRVDNLDEYRRLTWQKDERLFLTRWKYDDSTDGLLQNIGDVQVSSITDSPAVPTGWTTPSGGGLHLITDNTLDDLGRITQALGPTHSIDLNGTNTSLRRAGWTIYKDAEQEVRSAEGYATGSAPYTRLSG